MDIDSSIRMKIGQKIFKWYQQNKRDLPWRKNSNPYRIWISEIMLQQTTVQAVIPYYKKFLKKFPTLKSLAQSSLEEVVPYWSGLGYYSRVRNLHRSAQMFLKQNKGKLPQTAKELQVYPGFGPYTSQAVSSIAFGEPVSVLDGNVIRVLCRHEGLSIAWWKNTHSLEKKVDSWRHNLPSGDMNQAFMELGAVICTPRNPSCLVCPIHITCQARKLNKIESLPLKKPRKSKQIWLWRPQVMIKGNKILMIQKHSCPFLKKQWLFPGNIQRLKKPPKKYVLRHFITHYNIFVIPKYVKTPSGFQKKDKTLIWKNLDQIQQISPFSLTQKILHHSHFLSKK